MFASDCNPTKIFQYEFDPDLCLFEPKDWDLSQDNVFAELSTCRGLQVFALGEENLRWTHLDLNNEEPGLCQSLKPVEDAKPSHNTSSGPTERTRLTRMDSELVGRGEKSPEQISLSLLESQNEAADFQQSSASEKCVPRARLESPRIPLEAARVVQTRFGRDQDVGKPQSLAFVCNSRFS